MVLWSSHTVQMHLDSMGKEKSTQSTAEGTSLIISGIFKTPKGNKATNKLA